MVLVRFTDTDNAHSFSVNTISTVHCTESTMLTKGTAFGRFQSQLFCLDKSSAGQLKRIASVTVQIVRNASAGRSHRKQRSKTSNFGCEISIFANDCRFESGAYDRMYKY